MRRELHRILAERNIKLLHPDLWPFAANNVINCNVTETGLVDVALGLAEYNPVAVYGVAGFILLRATETLKLYTPKHSVLILNAGANGCYPKGIGYGHQIDYDKELCKVLGIDVIDLYQGRDAAVMKSSVEHDVDLALKIPGWHLLRLGWDL